MFGGNGGGDMSFGGMGFVPPATQDGVGQILNTATQANTLGGDSTAPAKKEFKSSVIPVTCKMLNFAAKQLASAQEPDAKIKIHGQEVQNLTLVAQVIAFQEHPSYLLFTIDDCTGTVQVKKWYDQDETETVARIKATMNVPQYVRVVGQCRSFSGQTFISAHHIANVQGDEIAAHIIEVLVVKKKIEQIKAGVKINQPAFNPFPKTAQNQNQPPNQFGSTAPPNQFGGPTPFGGPPQQQQNGPQQGNTFNAPQGGGNGFPMQGNQGNQFAPPPNQQQFGGPQQPQQFNGNGQQQTFGGQHNPQFGGNNAGRQFGHGAADPFNN